MNQAERDLIASLFQRIRGVESARRDPEAEAYISDQVARQPHAPYAMAQTVVVQDEALKAAQARIAELERELAAARSDAAPREAEDRAGPSPWGPRAQEAMGRPGGYDDERYDDRRDDRRYDDRRDDRYGDGAPSYDASRSTPGARPSYGGSGLAYGSPPPYGAQQPQPYPQQPQAPLPQQPEASRGGGFLSGALQTAAGVAAGAMIFQGVKSLFGGDEAHAQGAGDAARLSGQESAGGEAGDSTLQGISDQFSGWFGGGDERAAPEPDHGDDGDADFDGGGDDRWI